MKKILVVIAVVVTILIGAAMAMAADRPTQWFGGVEKGYVEKVENQLNGANNTVNILGWLVVFAGLGGYFLPKVINRISFKKEKSITAKGAYAPKPPQA